MKLEEGIDKPKEDKSKEEFFKKVSIDTVFKIIAKRCLIFIGVLIFAIFIIALVKSYF